MPEAVDRESSNYYILGLGQRMVRFELITYKFPALGKFGYNSAIYGYRPLVRTRARDRYQIYKRGVCPRLDLVYRVTSTLSIRLSPAPSLISTGTLQSATLGVENVR